MLFKQLKSKLSVGIPDIFFLALFLVWPWQTRYFISLKSTEYLTISLYLADILIFLGMIPLAIAHKTKQKEKINPVFLPFSISASITLAVALNKAVTAYFIVKLILAYGFGLLIARAELDTQKLVRFFMYGLMPVALLAIAQFMLQASWSNKWLGLAVHDPSKLGQVVIETANGERWLRAYGAFDHPNILGGIMAAALLLLIVYRQGKLRPAEVAATVLFSSALFFSFSRAAWLAFGVGLAVTAIRNLAQKGERELYRKIFLSLVIILSLAVSYSDLVFARTGTESRLEQKSINERISYYSQAKQLFVAQPLFGVGLGNYVPALIKINPRQPSWYYQPVHNAFVLAAVEVGALGVFVVLFIIAIIGKRVGVRKLIDNPLMPMWLMIAMLGLFDHWLWSLHVGLVFTGLLWGISVRLLQENN